MTDTKTDLPLIALSVMMIIGGLLMAFAVANLPASNKVVLGGFAALGVGFGTALFRTGLQDRIDRWSIACLLFGAAGFVIGGIAAIINHPASHVVFGL